MARETDGADPISPSNLERSHSLVNEIQLRNKRKRRSARLRDWPAGSSIRRYAMQMVGLERLLDLIEEWENWDEHIELKGRSSAIVTSSCFTSFSTFVIVVNIFFVAYETDWSMENLGSSRPAGLLVAECFFLSWYCIELLLRVEAYRWHFLSTSVLAWHVLDVFLVCISIIDVAVSLSFGLGDGSSDGNISYLRIVRIVKLAKIARTWRVVQAFKELSVIMESFKSSFLALFWCFVFLAFLLFVFSLILMQGAINYLEDPAFHIDEVVKISMIDAFGSLAGTMLSLYKGVTGGADWGGYYDLLLYTGDLYAAIYLFYTFFFGFAVVNLLTGIFVEKAMAAAQPDIEQRVLDKRKEVEQQCEELKRMIVALDKDSSGTISRGEFKKLCEDFYFMGYMATLGVDLSEAGFFFDLLASVNGRGQNQHYDEQFVHIDALVEGCLNMKGGASSIDMQRQITETQELRRQVDRITEVVSSTFDDMHEKFEAIINMKTASVPQQVDGVVDEALINMPNMQSTVFTSTVPHDRPPLSIDEWRDTNSDMVKIETTLRSLWAEWREEMMKFVEHQRRASADALVMERQLTETTAELDLRSRAPSGASPALTYVPVEGSSLPAQTIRDQMTMEDPMKDTAVPPAAAFRHPQANRNTWVVVGRHAIVNVSQDPTSKLVGCLKLGAILEELEVVSFSTEGGRLNFHKLSGEGPVHGWISIRSLDHTMAYRVEEGTWALPPDGVRSPQKSEASTLASAHGYPNGKVASPVKFRAPGRIEVGMRVVVSIGSKREAGTVRFIGTTAFAMGEWVGIELDKQNGKNNGTVEGKAYFECKDNHGVFCKPAAVTLVST